MLPCVLSRQRTPPSASLYLGFHNMAPLIVWFKDMWCWVLGMWLTGFHEIPNEPERRETSLSTMSLAPSEGNPSRRSVCHHFYGSVRSCAHTCATERFRISHSLSLAHTHRHTLYKLLCLFVLGVTPETMVLCHTSLRFQMADSYTSVEHYSVAHYLPPPFPIVPESVAPFFSLSLFHSLPPFHTQTHTHWQTRTGFSGSGEAALLQLS